MQTILFIPARFQSSRLPGKPLLADTGKPLIQYTYEQACMAKADAVYVVTDDQRIMDAVHNFGGKAVMTRNDHESGSSRIAEAAENLTDDLKIRKEDIIVNLQGDEPEIDPEHIDQLVALHKTASQQGYFASTLVCPFKDEGNPTDPSTVKAVLAPMHGQNTASDNFYQALYFSRALVPYPRDNVENLNPSNFHLHIGLYAFTAASLAAFPKLPDGKLEHIEKLEQLRILEAGKKMAAAIVDEACPGIDTPDDYKAFKARLA